MRTLQAGKPNIDTTQLLTNGLYTLRLSHKFVPTRPTEWSNHYQIMAVISLAEACLASRRLRRGTRVEMLPEMAPEETQSSLPHNRRVHQRHQ